MFNQISGGFSNRNFSRPQGPPPNGRPPGPHRRGQNGRPPGPPPNGQGGPGGSGGPRRGNGGGQFAGQIQQGIQNGSISSQEAGTLQGTQQEMRAFKQSVMADGQVTPQEHAQLKAYGDQMRQMVSQYSQG